MSTKDRQREFRKRMKEAGYSEVRGLYGLTEKHPEMKSEFYRKHGKPRLNNEKI